MIRAQYTWKHVTVHRYSHSNWVKWQSHASSMIPTVWLQLCMYEKPKIYRVIWMRTQMPIELEHTNRKTIDAWRLAMTIEIAIRIENDLFDGDRNSNNNQIKLSTLSIYFILFFLLWYKLHLLDYLYRC